MTQSYTLGIMTGLLYIKAMQDFLLFTIVRFSCTLEIQSIPLPSHSENLLSQAHTQRAHVALYYILTPQSTSVGTPAGRKYIPYWVVPLHGNCPKRGFIERAILTLGIFCGTRGTPI